jgi:hypothetical protein
MAIRTELTVKIPNNPGALARVCRALWDERVNILALSLESGGTLRTVVDNHVHAAGILRDQHYDVAERSVLYTVITNGPGAFYSVTKLLADSQVNVEYTYGSGIEGGTMAAIVIGVEDAARASAAAGI